MTTPLAPFASAEMVAPRLATSFEEQQARIDVVVWEMLERLSAEQKGPTL